MYFFQLKIGDMKVSLVYNDTHVCVQGPCRESHRDSGAYPAFRPPHAVVIQTRERYCFLDVFRSNEHNAVLPFLNIYYSFTIKVISK